MPGGFLGEPLMQVRFVCAAAPSHPLHALGRRLSLDDLRQYRHLVVRDSGVNRSRTAGWINEQRWTVSNKATSIRAACMGLGYAWYAAENIREELDAGALLPLPLAEGAERYVTLYLMYADREAAGPGVLRLGEILREKVAEQCVQAGHSSPRCAAACALRRAMIRWITRRRRSWPPDDAFVEPCATK